MLPKLSVKKPFTVVVAVVMILVLGVVSFMGMTTDMLPKMNLPYVVILTGYPGASPEEVELAVTRPIEQSMATVNNINNITSNSSENASMVFLEFAQTTNMDSASLEIREKLDMIKGYFPDSVTSPTMLKINPEMLPVMVAAVDIENKTSAEVSRITQSDVMPGFESLEGVATVSLTGLIEEDIHVILRQEKIDKINKELKDHVENEMDDAAEKLADAKAQIKSGKYKLNKEKSKIMGQIGQAEKVLSDAKKKISDGEAQIAESEQQIAFLENLLKTGKQEIEKQKKNLKAERSVQVSRQKELEAIDPRSPEQEDELARVKLRIQAIDAAIAGLQFGSDEVAKINKDIAAQRKQLEAAKAQVKAGKKELAEQEKKLNQGKNKAVSGFSAASGKLNSAEKQVNEGIAQLEDSREEALEQASVDNFLTMDMLKGLLTAENFSMPAGYVAEKGTDYLVRVGDKIGDLKELSGLLLIDLDIEGIDPIYLSDVADVIQVDNSAETYGKVNGNQAVLMTFQKQPEYSTSDVSARIQEKAKTLPGKIEGLHFTPLMDQGIYINLVINSVLENLLYGALLAILILLIFLRDVRPTVVIAFSIPISLVFAIVLMYFSGVTLNIISLSGLALGVGMLVDNSIVVIENIYRLRNMGVPPAKAAVEGTKEMTGAIFSSTLTTICVFAPIVFVQGISRQLFTDIALTITFSLLASLLVALTLVPMMASGALRNVSEKRHRIFDLFKRFYAFTLKGALKVKILVVLAAFALFGLSGYYMLSMGTGFMPEMDSTQISVQLEMEKDTPLVRTAAATDKVMEKILAIPGVESVGAMQGSGGMSGMGSMLGLSSDRKLPTDSMSMYVILKEDKSVSSQEIAKQIEALSGEAGCTLTAEGSSMDMSALGGSGVSIMIKGPEIDGLRDLSGQIAKIVEGTEGTENVSDGIADPTPELRITVDKEKAMAEGLTVAQVYMEISALLADPTTATTLNVNGTDYPVIVIDGEQEKLTLDDVRGTKITVTDKEGEEKEIRVSSIAATTDDISLSTVQRDNQQRYLKVTAEIKEGYNIGLVSRELETKLTAIQVPEGYSVQVTGENETINDAMNDLVLMLALAIILIYLIMVAQFQSLQAPFIVMFTIPLAMTGGLFALYFTKNDLSVIAIVGFIMLAGIVVNNGIVLIDCIIRMRRDGKEKKEAILEAGRVRLRPILMTAITTILGLIPMAVGMGMGSNMVQPLAIVTIGGLTYATLLTLYVVPCMYDLINRKKDLRDALQKEEDLQLALEGEGRAAELPAQAEEGIPAEAVSYVGIPAVPEAEEPVTPIAREPAVLTPPVEEGVVQDDDQHSGS